MIYVTSDLHGCKLSELTDLLSMANFLDEDTLFILGDVIDRGFHTIELLKWLMIQDNVYLILGNHETMMLSCPMLFEEITDEAILQLSDRDFMLLRNWMNNGGSVTMRLLSEERSRNPEFIEDVVAYFRDAVPYEEIEVNGQKFILTHSGLGNFSPAKKMEQYSLHELTWTRPTIDDVYYEDAITVFGHTPTTFYGEEYKGKPIITKTWINVDVGAAYGYPPILLRLDDMELFRLEATEEPFI